MGANLGQGIEPCDLHSGVDLGPQEKHPGFPGALTFENASKPGQPLRPRSASAAGRSFNFWMADEGGAGGSYVLEMGLVGDGSSIRSLQHPLDYVRVQSDHLILSQYDGTQRFRTDATFELRRGELEDEIGTVWVCLMLANRPGLYAHMEKDGQIMVKPYTYLHREAFHFKVLVEGPASPLLWDVSEPSMGLNGPSCSAASEVVPAPELKLKFMPTFSLPDYDFGQVPSFTAAVCDNFEKVD